MADNGNRYVMSPYVQMGISHWSSCSRKSMQEFLEKGLGTACWTHPNITASNYHKCHLELCTTQTSSALGRSGAQTLCPVTWDQKETARHYTAKTDTKSVYHANSHLRTAPHAPPICGATIRCAFQQDKDRILGTEREGHGGHGQLVPEHVVEASDSKNESAAVRRP